MSSQPIPNAHEDRQTLTGTPPRSPLRWSAEKKQEVVLRLLRGETIEELSRESGVAQFRLAEWRDVFLDAGRNGLKKRQVTPEERELKEAKATIGDMAMKIGIFEEYLAKKGLTPPHRRSAH